MQSTPADNSKNLGYENASQPGLSEQEIQAKLHFVVVGGGPTVRVVDYHGDGYHGTEMIPLQQGIEFSGELYDFLSNDMARLYPELVAKTRMSLYDVAPQILGSFDSQLSLYAHKKFDRKGIQIKTSKYIQRHTKSANANARNMQNGMWNEWNRITLCFGEKAKVLSSCLYCPYLSNSCKSFP